MITTVRSITVEMKDVDAYKVDQEEDDCIQFDVSSSKILVNLNTKTIYVLLQDNMKDLLTDQVEMNLNQILAIVQQQSIKKMEINYIKVKSFDSAAIRRMFRFIYKFVAINKQKCKLNFYYNHSAPLQRKYYHLFMNLIASSNPVVLKRKM